MPSIVIPDDLQVPDDLASKITEELQKRPTPDIDAHTYSQIWFIGDIVVKQKRPTDVNTHEDRVYGCLKDASVARDLSSHGFTVPQIYGVHCAPHPLMVMQRMNMIAPLRKLPSLALYSYLRRGITQRQALTKLENMKLQLQQFGYIPTDCGLDNNAGWTSDKKICLFDFEQWTIPDHIQEKIKACFVGYETFPVKARYL